MFEAHEMLIQCMMNPSALPSRASGLYTLCPSSWIDFRDVSFNTTLGFI